MALLYASAKTRATTDGPATRAMVVEAMARLVDQSAAVAMSGKAMNQYQPRSMLDANNRRPLGHPPFFAIT